MTMVPCIYIYTYIYLQYTSRISKIWDLQNQYADEITRVNGERCRYWLVVVMHLSIPWFHSVLDALVSAWPPHQNECHRFYLDFISQDDFLWDATRLLCERTGEIWLDIPRIDSCHEGWSHGISLEVIIANRIIVNHMYACVHQL